MSNEPLKKEVMAENKNLKGALQESEHEKDQMAQTIESTAAENESLAAEVARMTEILNARQAPEVIIAERGTSEPMEQQIGQDSVAEFTEAAGDATESPVIEKVNGVMDVDSPEFDEKMAYEAFMKEPVTVLIQETNEENAQMIFEVSVNGFGVVFSRGETKTVPRYIVEGLARAKPVKYKNEEYTMPDGVRSVRWPSTSGLRYPFSIIGDQNPKGPAWLTAVLRQP